MQYQGTLAYVRTNYACQMFKQILHPTYKMIAFIYCKKIMGFVDSAKTKEHSGNCF